MVKKDEDGEPKPSKKKSDGGAAERPPSLQISGLVKTLNKKLKNASIRVLEDHGIATGVDIPWFLSTGALNLDWALGRGIPGGRLIEIYSRDFSEGKSSLVHTIAAAAQEQEAVVALLDGENATVKSRLRSLGVDTKNLIFEAPDTLEDGFALIDVCIKEIRLAFPVEPILIIWDAIGSTPSIAEMEAEYNANSIGVQARVMSKSLKKLIPVLRDNQASLVCTNQVRNKIGASAYGETLDSVGGKSMKFYSHQRIELRRTGWIKAKVGGEDKALGIEIRAKIKKNKIFEPLREADMKIMFAGGISREHSELEFGIRVGLVNTEAQGYYTIDGGKKFRAADYDANKPEDFDVRLYEALENAE